MMAKKVLTFIFFLCIIACSSDNEDTFDSASQSEKSNDEEVIELIPVKDVFIPTTIKVGKPASIKVFYERPTTCYTFKDIFYNKDGNERTIAIVSEVTSSSNCEITGKIEETDFEFLVDEIGLYKLKFWVGKDDAGNAKYVIYDLNITM